MALTTLTGGELYQEVADLARDQGASTKDDWDELVEDVVESHLSLGEIDLDEDTEGLKETLRSKWRVYRTDTDGEEADGDLDGAETQDTLEGFGESEEDEM